MTDNKEMTASQMLYEARTLGRRKREISTISKLLCIREEYLAALENGDYNFIPEVVYILGFARNYAMELGLDPDEVVCKIKREIGLISDCESEEAPVVEAKEEKKEKKTSFFEKLSKYVSKHWKWVLAGLVMLAVLILGTAFVASLGDEKEVAPVEEVVAEVVVSTAPEFNAPVREKFGTENIEKSNVTIQAIQESWVKIEDARGNTVFSRVLVPGDIYYVPEGNKYKGTFGNAGGVDVWVNGKLAPKIGAAHTRKAGVSMAPNSLMPETAATKQ